MSKALSIVGSSRKNGERDVDDFYPTPSYAVLELLKREIFEGLIWEPACGDGAISEVLLKAGYEVYSSDLVYRNYGVTQDFFSDFRIVQNIITNPPYSEAQRFVEQSKIRATEKIAMFLKTVFLESESRYNMFQDKKFPLKTVYQFSKRVSLYKGGIKMKNSGMISYAWYVWDKAYIGKPQIEWIL